jgi:iron complex transport system ATP-binding protein
VVVVPHDPGLAAACAHRVAIQCAGRVAADGPPGEVFTGRLLSDVYDQRSRWFRTPGRERCR